mmetsp:Transcript_32496/g.87257  ORF Transcript_32496/g.87257 Transcript_32496/m.87257 type:complete len:218 (-) Transcript_32496:275-928(-)
MLRSSLFVAELVDDVSGRPRLGSSSLPRPLRLDEPRDHHLLLLLHPRLQDFAPILPQLGLRQKFLCSRLRSVHRGEQGSTLLRSCFAFPLNLILQLGDNQAKLVLLTLLSAARAFLAQISGRSKTTRRELPGLPPRRLSAICFHEGCREMHSSLPLFLQLPSQMLYCCRIIFPTLFQQLPLGLQVRNGLFKELHPLHDPRNGALSIARRRFLTVEPL